VTITGTAKTWSDNIDDQLSTTGAQELLASTSAAQLAYIAKDGTPRVIPVGFFWTDDQVVISPGHDITEVHPNVGECIWRSTSFDRL
jgi:hypothetical protein